MPEIQRQLCSVDKNAKNLSKNLRNLYYSFVSEFDDFEWVQGRMGSVWYNNDCSMYW